MSSQGPEAEPSGAPAETHNGAIEHIILVRYRLDGSEVYRPYAACECGWEGSLRSSYLEAEMDGRWHRVDVYEHPGVPESPRPV